MTYPTIHPDISVADLVIDVLSANLREIEDYEQQLPWVLLCTDCTSGDTSASGPFATRSLAERIRQHEITSAGPDSSLSFALAPLYPALQLAEPGMPVTGS